MNILEGQTGERTGRGSVARAPRRHVRKRPARQCLCTRPGGPQGAGDQRLYGVARIDDLLGIGALKEIAADAGEIKSMRTDPSHIRKGVAARLVGAYACMWRARAATGVPKSRDRFRPAVRGGALHSIANTVSQMARPSATIPIRTSTSSCIWSFRLWRLRRRRIRSIDLVRLSDLEKSNKGKTPW